MALQKYNQMGTGVLDKTYSNMASGVDENTFRTYDLTEMDAAALEQQTWEETLRMTSTLKDVFELGMADVIDVTDRGMSIPNGCGMKLTAGGASTVHRFPLLDPLVGTPRAGTGEDLLGYERGQRMRYVEAFYNEMKDGVIVEQYGVNYNKVDVYGIYERATSQLNKYWAEVRGRAKRECLTQWYNIELTKPGSAAPGQNLNPNWLIAGETNGTAPAWDSTLQTFTNTIGAAMDAAGGTSGTGVSAQISMDVLDRFAFEAESNLYMEPLDDGMYLVVIPEPQWYKLSSLTDGQMGGLWQNVNRYSNDKATFPGEVGSYRSLRIIKDTRWASLVATEATGNYTFSIEYVQPGGRDGDARNKGLYTYNQTTGNRIWQLGWLMGKGAYIERMEKDLFFRNELQEYEKRKGIGTFMECGWNLNVIKTDTSTGTGPTGFPDYADNRSSAVLAFAATRV
jgi:hypothetical protein